MLRSISVSSPTVSTLTSFPEFLERSLTSRDMRWKVCLMGIIRRTVEERCSSEVMLSSREMSRTIFRSPRLLRVSLCRIMDWVMTSSPTMSMRSSSFLMSTRIVLESVTCWACLRRARVTSLGEAIPSEMSVWPSFRDGGAWERSSAPCSSSSLMTPSSTRMVPSFLGSLGRSAPCSASLMRRTMSEVSISSVASRPS